jgi:hypothetical protein
MSQVAITIGYRHQPAARAPIDAGKLVVDNGKPTIYRHLKEKLSELSMLNGRILLANPLNKFLLY